MIESPPMVHAQSTRSSPFTYKLRQLFGIDVRSLALFRIVLALLALGDIVDRALNLSAHYTDKGVLPRAALLSEPDLTWSFSLHLVSGNVFVQLWLFLCAALAAILLLLGWHTRTMTLILWLFFVSVHERNPLILNGADSLLRLLFFWAIFLPLGSIVSFDSRRNNIEVQHKLYFSCASAGILLQVVFLYFFSVIHKSGDEWRIHYTALYYALSIDHYRTALGTLIYGFPVVLSILTFSVFWFEALGPAFLFSPFMTGPVRTITAWGFVILHSGIWLAMSIGSFPWIAGLSMVIFFPAWFWDNIDSLRERNRVQIARLSRWWRKSRETFQVSVAALPVDRESPRKKWLSRSFLWSNVFCAICIVYIFAWNLTTISHFRFPPSVEAIGLFLRLDQSWDMFSPYPFKDDGWFVLRGVLQNGDEIDALQVIRGAFSLEEQVVWDKPRRVADLYRNERWRKYLGNLWYRDNSHHRAHLSRYICNEWNRRYQKDQQLKQLSMFYMLEITQPDYQSIEPEQILLWDHTCE
jgi:hypothetical protein